MKDKHIPFYTHAEAKDFAFLIDDLKPVLIVLDQKTAQENLPLFKQEFEKSVLMKTIPCVVIGTWDDLDFIPKKHAQIELPLKPPALVKALENWHSEVSTLRS